MPTRMRPPSSSPSDSDLDPASACSESDASDSDVDIEADASTAHESLIDESHPSLIGESHPSLFSESHRAHAPTLPSHHAHALTLTALRRESQDIYNRTRSIAEDAAFVQHVRAAYPGLPLVPNMRCGAWYTDPRL
ncbi:initiator tRNA phosphoribosyl transferase-domain-containing protein, partial [Hygrophoropsis aurantiaca]